MFCIEQKDVFPTAALLCQIDKPFIQSLVVGAARERTARMPSEP